MNVIAPWYYPAEGNATVWVVNYGTTGHTLYTVDLLSVTFSGSTDYSLQIQCPLPLYFNDTQGVCGNSNGNPHDDPTCPDGQPIDTCWERHHKSTTYSPTSPGTTISHTGTTELTTTPTYPLCDNATQQQVNQECSIIMNYDSGPFAICALNASDLGAAYYQMCTYDLCAALNQSNALCALLQAYADACMQQIPNITLHWRTESFCRKFWTIPKSSHLNAWIFKHQIVLKTCITKTVVPVAQLHAVIHQHRVNVSCLVEANVLATRDTCGIMVNVSHPVNVGASTKKADIIKYLL